MKKFVKTTRKGFSLVELLIAVVVLGILGAMLIAAGTAAQNKARVSVASNDIDSVRNAVYTAFMMKPQVMQYTDNTDNWAKIVVDNINAELDENWQWTLLDPANTKPHSGPIAQTKNMRDPWKNPYTMYIYTDSFAEKYVDEAGASLPASDSVMYVVIASAGPNGTGVGMGVNGEIIVEAGAVAATDKIGGMVNNTDGVDDLGVVIRIRNGSTTQATFGWDAAMLGTLKDKQWVFCAKTGAGNPAPSVNGTYTRRTGNNLAENSGGYTVGTSLDRFPNKEMIDKLSATEVQLGTGA